MTVKLVIKEKFEVIFTTREDSYKRDNEINVSMIIYFFVKDLFDDFIDNEISFSILILVLIVILIVILNDEAFFRLIYIVIICSLRSVFDIKRSKELTLISILILILILKELRIERAFDVISYLFLIYKERHYNLYV